MIPQYDIFIKIEKPDFVTDKGFEFWLKPEITNFINTDTEAGGSLNARCYSVRFNKVPHGLIVINDENEILTFAQNLEDLEGKINTLKLMTMPTIYYKKRKEKQLQKNATFPEKKQYHTFSIKPQKTKK